MIVKLLNHRSDVDHFCTAYPELGNAFFPSGEEVEANCGCPSTVGGPPNERVRRFAVVHDETRTAIAVLTHDWPFFSNCMMVHAVAAHSEAALASLTTYLRTFLDRNREFCCGLQLSLATKVHPTPQVSVPAVFRTFADIAANGDPDHPTS